MVPERGYGSIMNFLNRLLICNKCPSYHFKWTECPLICGRCYEATKELVDSKCHEKPERFGNAPIGQYHCPDCGAMVLAGLPHPTVCKRCADRKHPGFDAFLEIKNL